jgi:hypothetical protein
MNEYEIDQNYLDNEFVNIINIMENEKFAELINLFLENYENSLSHERLTYYTKIISSSILDIDSHKLMRQIKYLINKGVYNRLSKKFKNDLLQLLLDEEKIDTLIEIERFHLDKIRKIKMTRKIYKV